MTNEQMSILQDWFLWLAVLFNLVSIYINATQAKRNAKELERYRTTLQKIAFGCYRHDEIIDMAVHSVFRERKQ